MSDTLHRHKRRPRQRQQRLGEATTPDGELLTLHRLADAYEVRVGRETLMSSHQRGSEEMMATLALPLRPAPAGTRVLIGGLGMGFTLRAVLDRLGGEGVADVAELLPAVVEWNRGVLGHLAGAPLDDSRTRLHPVDVRGCVADAGHNATLRYHAIALDVDNGPQAFTVRTNDTLYARDGLRTIREALHPAGRLIVWSAFRSPRFEDALRQAGFDARSVTARARGSKGARHTLFEGIRPR